MSTKRSAFVPHDLAHPIKGAGSGPLTGLTAAIKDMYDIAGEITGGGNPAWCAAHAAATHNAVAVEKLLAAGADIVGKTICDEFFYSIIGANAHYGTPVNPRAPGRVPGGSSSGSAAAVAAGAVDLALGSDTGGSVRVPAALNGIYGLRPTHGRADLTGAMAMAATFDTCGWFAAGPGLLRTCGGVLLGSGAVKAPVKRVAVAADALALADPVVGHVLRRFLARIASTLPAVTQAIVAPQGFDPWREVFRTIQAFETWQVYGAWLDGHDAKLGPGTRERMAYAKTVTAAATASARMEMAEVRRHIHGLVPPGTLLILPTAPAIAPRVDASQEEFESFRKRTLSLTCIAGLGGLPQITLPAGTAENCPAGVSFIGWPGADETLLDLAVDLGRFCGD